MTDEHDKTGPERPGDAGADERELMEPLAEAFVRRGELPPATEAEVERAEAGGVEFEGELPESLRSHRPKERGEPLRAVGPESGPAPRNVASLADARRARFGWPTHLIAAALGAAAASALLLSRTRPPEPAGGGATSEPPPPVLDAARAPEQVVLAPRPACPTACCAGTKCKASKPELSQCSSGRDCIPCAFEDLAESRYRIRLGAFAPLDAGRKLLDATKTGLELCVRVGSSPLVCAPARAASEGAASWTVLPLTASVQELMAGLTLRVRATGSETSLGEWLSPVQINATTLCRGLFLKPVSGANESLGTVSLFLDDTHFVELGRGADVSALREQRGRFDAGALPLSIFETSGASDQRFTLVLGPFDKPTADGVRWDLLQKAEHPRLTLGDDHLGAPLRLR